MQCVNRSIPPRLPQGLMTPLDRVQPISGGNRPGSWEVSSSLTKICSRGRGKSMPRQGDRTATARWQPRFRMLSPNGTTPQVDQTTHTEAFGDFSQLRATCREDTAQQPIPAKLVELNLPTLQRYNSSRSNIPASSAEIDAFPWRKAAGVVNQLLNHREATDGHRKNTREFLEPVLQPVLAVVVSCTEQTRAANTARHAVIPAGKGHINQLGSSDRHRESPGAVRSPVLCVITVGPSRSFSLLVAKNQRRNRLSRALSTERLCRASLSVRHTQKSRPCDACVVSAMSFPPFLAKRRPCDACPFCLVLSACPFCPVLSALSVLP